MWIHIILLVLFSFAFSLADLGTCGESDGHATTIYRGDEVNKGDWPWLTAIFRTTGHSIEFICGGSLVTKSHVVTAAHCLYLPGNSKPTIVQSKDLLLYFGKHNLLYGDNASDVQIRTVKEKIIPPRYSHSGKVKDSDIAVIVLVEPVIFTTLIRPVCLWENTGTDDTNLGTVVGWGTTNDDEQLSGVPKFVRIPIVSNQECIGSLTYFQTSGIVTNNTICAGKRDGSGTCHGDSGGGMYIVRGERWVLRGIISKSILNKNTGGCNLAQFAVLTDVYAFIPWLHRVIGEDQLDKTCTSAQFTCTNGKCIQKSYVCDKDNDCGDESDEASCPCDEVTQFDCGANTCIKIGWKCDGDKDCTNGADEQNCPLRCTSPQVLCADKSKCIQETWKCDGEKDCSDGSDEIGCASSSSTSSQVTSNSPLDAASLFANRFSTTPVPSTQDAASIFANRFTTPSS